MLGAWLACSVLTDCIAVQNFQSVNRFIADPGLSAIQDIHTLGPDKTRVLLRHLAGEQNRFFFEQWEWVQLALGTSLLLLLVFGGRPPKVAILLTLTMLLIVLCQRAGLTPQITRLGRILDYIPPETASPKRTLFWSLHGIYSGVELAKLALGFFIAGSLIVRRNPDPAHFVREAELDAIPPARNRR